MLEIIFLLLLLRTQAINSYGHPQSKHASQNTTYLPNPGVDFCVYGPFLSHHKGNHTPTPGSCRENLEKRQSEDHRRQKEEKNFGGKREYDRKEEPAQGQ